MHFNKDPGKSRVYSPLRFAVQSLCYLPRCITDPLVHHGRHFGRTVHALCNIQALLTNGIQRMGEFANGPEGSLTAEFVNSHCFNNYVFIVLLAENAENIAFFKSC